MGNCMELIFKTNSEVELYQDIDGSYISTNPAEVLCSIFEDLKGEDFIANINAQFLLIQIAEKGGIYYDPKGSKKVLSDKRLCFLASDSEGNNLFGWSTATKFDNEVRKELHCYPTILHVVL